MLKKQQQHYSLCGHDQCVMHLSQMGARDDKYARCYLNSLNLGIRRLLKSFNIYKHLSFKHSNQSSLTDIYLNAFNKYVLQRDDLSPSVTTHGSDSDSDSDDDGSGIDETVGSTDFTILLENADGVVVKEYPCHLFMLITQLREAFVLKFILREWNDEEFTIPQQQPEEEQPDDRKKDKKNNNSNSNSSSSRNNNNSNSSSSRNSERRSVLTELMKKKLSSIDDQVLRQRLYSMKNKSIRISGFSEAAFELFLKYVYTATLTAPGDVMKQISALEAKEQKEVEKAKEEHLKLYAHSYPPPVFAPNSAKSSFRQDILFGNTIPDRIFVSTLVKAQDSSRRAVKDMETKFNRFNKPLVDELLLVAKYFNCYELIDIITEQLEYRDIILRFEFEKTLSKTKKSFMPDRERARIELIHNEIKQRFLNRLQDIVFIEQGQEQEQKHDKNDKLVHVVLRECVDIGVTVPEECRDDENFTVYCPKCVLMWRSDFFRLSLTGGFSEALDFLEAVNQSQPSSIEHFEQPYSPPPFLLYDCSQPGVIPLLKYIFFEDTNVPTNVAVEVLMLGSRLGPWSKLQDACVELIRNNITQDNALDLLLIGDVFFDSKTMKECVLVVKRMYKNEPRDHIEQMLREKGVAEDHIVDIVCS